MKTEFLKQTASMNSQKSALEYLHVLLLRNTVTAESCNKRPATNKRLLSPRALNRINTVDALQRPVTTVPEVKDCQLTIGIANRNSIIKRPTFIQWAKVRRTVFSNFWTSRPIGFSVERYKHFYDPWMTLAFHITKKRLVCRWSLVFLLLKVFLRWQTVLTSSRSAARFFRFISATLQVREKTKKTSGPRKYSSVVTKKKIACEQALQCEGPPPLLARSLQGRFPRHNWRACSPAKKELKTNQKLQVKIMTAWKVIYSQTVFFPQK